MDERDPRNTKVRASWRSASDVADARIWQSRLKALRLFGLPTEINVRHNFRCASPTVPRNWPAILRHCLLATEETVLAIKQTRSAAERARLQDKLTAQRAALRVLSGNGVATPKGCV